MSLADYVAARVGTRRWVVAPRLTPRLREQGYEKAVTQKRFTALKAEHDMVGKPMSLSGGEA
tara:strand:- start:8667 stop:8852 length:186 start_codon:yes stop_codon:yes gene_type:complete